MFQNFYSCDETCFANTLAIWLIDFNVFIVRFIMAMSQFCRSLDEWFSGDPENVVGIHCKAGKGRTGLLIATYLVHSAQSATANDALFKFGMVRTQNGKGVTIPSQMRYVHYYDQYMRRGDLPTNTFQLTHIRMTTVPTYDTVCTLNACCSRNKTRCST